MDDLKGWNTDYTDYPDYTVDCGDGAESEKRGPFLHRDITGAVIGGMYAVHTELGSGFLEGVYANALTIVLRGAGLLVEREVVFEIVFHGERIGWYRADMIVEKQVLVEVKAAEAIHERHRAQVRNYLRASGLELGLVLNFGPSAKAARVISTPG